MTPSPLNAAMLASHDIYKAIQQTAVDPQRLLLAHTASADEHLHYSLFVHGLSQHDQGRHNSRAFNERGYVLAQQRSKGGEYLLCHSRYSIYLAFT